MLYHVLGLVLYAVIGIIVSYLRFRYSDDDASTATFMGGFWPIAIPIMTMLVFMDKVYDLALKHRIRDAQKQKEKLYVQSVGGGEVLSDD
jgi:hypothetical protein